jgi:hypothetical protein
VNLIMDLIGGNLQWLIGGVVGLLAILGGYFKIKSDAKREGVREERTRQVETARKETTVAVETRNQVHAAPKTEVEDKFSKYVRPKK